MMKGSRLYSRGGIGFFDACVNNLYSIHESKSLTHKTAVARFKSPQKRHKKLN